MQVKHAHIWVTRRRWDFYFLTGTLIAALIGVLSWRYFADPRSLTAPLFMVALWAYLRWYWPREGSAVRTISGSPGLIPLLWFILIWGGVGVGGLFVSELFLKLPDKGEPWLVSHVVIFAAFLVVEFSGLFVGVHWIERRFKTSKTSVDDLLE